MMDGEVGLPQAEQSLEELAGQLEQSLLGGLLMRPRDLERVSELVEPAHFFYAQHEYLFEVMLRISAQGFTPTVDVLARYIGPESPFAPAEFKAFLTRLVDSVVHLMLEDLAVEVRDLAIRRQLVAVGGKIIQDASRMQYDRPVSEIVRDGEEALFRLGGGRVSQDPLAAARLFEQAVGRVDRQARGDGTRGLLTGYSALDDLLGSIQGGDLVILAGRPSMGKTALATGILRRAAATERDRALEAGKPDSARAVVLVSMEMSADQVADRLMADRAGIPLHELRQGLTSEKAAALRRAAAEMSQLPMLIDDRPFLSVEALGGICRRAARNGSGIAAVIVDYLQLLSGRGENRVQEVSRITAGLKALARDLNVPLIALSQLSRNVEARDDKRPQLSDLRESGSIEQDADVVMFVYREEYYLSRAEPLRKDGEGDVDFKRRHTAWADRLEEVRGRVDVIVGKHRMGPIGTAVLGFEDTFARFVDVGSD